LSAGTAYGQIPSEPNPASVRVRMGRLWLNPTLSLTNAGIDTNVFNDFEADQPKRDFTLTVSPQTDLWLRMGRTWVLGNIKEDIVWYNKYSSQRSANPAYALSWLVPLTRLTFVVGGNLLHTNERPGFEIDARADRKERGVNGAFEIRALSRTLFGARAEFRKSEFADDAVYLGASLHDELNRTLSAASVTIRHELTPLTSFVVDVGRQKERFDFSPLRDTDSTQINVGLRFDAFALINGFAQVGFRDFAPLSADLPRYTGSIASVNLSYVALGSTRLGVIIGRDIQHSFDFNQPYYLQTGIAASIGQQIYGPLDVQGRIGSQRLAYRDRAISVTVIDRQDKVRSYGAGIGYRLGRDLRLGFNVDQQRRESVIDERRYEGLRYGIAATYGQ
jgi:Putative beta-barrel porin 2